MSAAAAVIGPATRESPFLREPAAEFEVIPARDTRQLVADTRGVPYRWICSLDVTFQRPYPRAWTTGHARGTGLLIGPRHVLTAAHNLFPDGETRPASVTVTPGRNGQSAPFGSVKSTGWSLPGAALRGKDRIVRDFDFAVVALEREIASVRHATLGNAPLGHWGSQRLGQGTRLEPLSLETIRGRTVAACGYPGDRCGRRPFDPDDKRESCPSKDHATTQWISTGEAQRQPGRDRWLLHTADTAKGQSGSPVWIRFADGRRCLVGVHVDRLWEYGARGDAPPVLKPVRANVAVHLRADVLQLIRSWLG